MVDKIKYIAILRGINVGGNKLIKMDSLRLMLENIGFVNVKSYIQSGNLIFNYKLSDCKILAQNISDKIKELLFFDVPVIVLGINELEKIYESNPFLKILELDISYLHITFLSDVPKNEKLLLLQKDFDNIEFKIINKSVYLFCPYGYSKSKLTNSLLEKKLNVTATTRNLKTVIELIKMAKSN